MLEKNGTATANLRISNNNELLLDHQTGKHVQGMVSVEASRQMFIAVVSLDDDIADMEDPYFIINNISINYKAFLFPLSAKLIFTPLKKEISHKGFIEFSGEVIIKQFSTITSVAEISMSVSTNTNIKNIEESKLENMISGALK